MRTAVPIPEKRDTGSVMRYLRVFEARRVAEPDTASAPMASRAARG
ncbi:MAG TPA: hypothetical protein VKV38_11810 [Trebonia sp.]|nr:hypothetical protein [Trebonia sp.]